MVLPECLMFATVMLAVNARVQMFVDKLTETQHYVLLLHFCIERKCKYSQWKNNRHKH